MSTSLVDESRRLRATARDAALAVSEQLRAAFRTTMTKDFKRDAHDVVTMHDKASEVRIIEVILDQVPDSRIVGEEGGTTGDGRVEWHIDPIDGTSNFARGIAYWCVSIAAVVEERVVAGVVYNPMSGDLFSADLTGAWLGDAPMRALASETELGATIVSSFPNAKDTGLFGSSAFEAQALLVENFQAVRNLGSGALNLAHVAAGWADATMGFFTNSWDIAAGSLLVEQAGGRFVALADGEPFSPVFHTPDYYAVGIDAHYPTLEGVVERWSSRYAAVRR